MSTREIPTPSRYEPVLVTIEADGSTPILLAEEVYDEDNELIIPARQGK